MDDVVAEVGEPEGEKMKEVESCVLPIDAHAERIVSHVKENRVTVIHGETGCGKSSRVPLILLKAMRVSRVLFVCARARACDGRPS